MNFESIFKDTDPVIVSILDKALSDKEISVKEGIELLDIKKSNELNLLTIIADQIRSKSVGNVVTYVVNRNINFTNVCIKGCGFCAFSRDFREDEGYFLPAEEIVRRAQEARRFGATEVCIQAGLPPKMDGFLYVDLCKKIKKQIPDIHIHAFSPEEILYGASRAEISIEEYLKLLKDAGIGSLPGTSAEILDQKIRDIISPGRIRVDQWINVIKTAHRLKIPTTSTIMYGHIETNEHISEHMNLIRTIQKETKGFTEFVPLSFVHSEAPMYNEKLVKNIRTGPTGFEVIKIHAIARLMLNNLINNIQVSWVKEGPRMSQFLLCAGSNDLGGTLMNESISTSAGARYGQLMRPIEITNIIKSCGRIPMQRTSTYKLIDEKLDEDKIGSLDSLDPNIFGSYDELIKLDRFRFKDLSANQIK